MPLLSLTPKTLRSQNHLRRTYRLPSKLVTEIFNVRCSLQHLISHNPNHKGTLSYRCCCGSKTHWISGQRPEHMRRPPKLHSQPEKCTLSHLKRHNPKSVAILPYLCLSRPSTTASESSCPERFSHHPHIHIQQKDRITATSRASISQATIQLINMPCRAL